MIDSQSWGGINPGHRRQCRQTYDRPRAIKKECSSIKRNTEERDEGHKLKRKYEDMQNEVRNSKTELQTLYANKMALEVYVEKTEKDAQNNLAKLQRLQLEN